MKLLASKCGGATPDCPRLYMKQDGSGAVVAVGRLLPDAEAANIELKEGEYAVEIPNGVISVALPMLNLYNNGMRHDTNDDHSRGSREESRSSV